jgi:hypothetical protein
MFSNFSNPLSHKPVSVFHCSNSSVVSSFVLPSLQFGYNFFCDLLTCPLTSASFLHFLLLCVHQWWPDEDHQQAYLMPLHLQLLCLFIFSFLRCSITVFRVRIIILFFFIVLYHNLSFSMLGPTIIDGHKTFTKHVEVKDFPRRVFLLILIVNTWTTHKTILNVCPSHIVEITKAFNVLRSASVTVHSLS